MLSMSKHLLLTTKFFDKLMEKDRVVCILLAAIYNTVSH